MAYVLGIVLGYFFLSMFQHWISGLFTFLGNFIGVLFYPFHWISANIVYLQPWVYTSYGFLVFVFAFALISKHLLNKSS